MADIWNGHPLVYLLSSTWSSLYRRSKLIYSLSCQVLFAYPKLINDFDFEEQPSGTPHTEIKKIQAL